MRSGKLLALGTVLLVAACTGSRPSQETRNLPAGYYKVGQPYQINGRWYYPAYDPRYDRVGTASWYGDDFHGRPTANGEVFDKNLVTAAHPTLPLPSVVRVTNLDNGKSLELRVNDRGPFIDDRLIDLSQAAAQELGYEDRGLANVRVQFVRLADARGEPPLPMVARAAPVSPSPRPAPTMVADLTPPRASTPVLVSPPIRVAQLAEPPLRTSPPVEPVTRALPPAEPPARAATLPWPAQPGRPLAAASAASARPAALPLASRSVPPPEPARVVPAAAPVLCTLGPQLVQVGAFTDPGKARSAVIAVRELEAVRLEPVLVNGAAVARVRLGPVADRQTALVLLERVRRLGYTDAFLTPSQPSAELRSC